MGLLNWINPFSDLYTGSDGYRPSNEQVEEQGNLLNKVFSNGYKSDYTKGASGYNVSGANSSLPAFGQYKTTEYNPTQYNAPKLINEAEKYYGQMENQATNQALASGQAGMDMMKATMGKRGMGQSGVNRQAQGNIADTMAKQINEAKTNIGFQRARDYNQIAQQQAELDYRGSQFNEANKQFGVNLSEQGRQYGANLADKQRLQSLQEATTQADLDRAIRQEKANEYYTPYQYLQNLYNTNMGIASQGVSGVNQKVGNYFETIGKFFSMFGGR